MADLVVVFGVLAFVAICVAYVAGCDRIIGPDVVEGESVDGDRVSLPSVPGSGR